MVLNIEIQKKVFRMSWFDVIKKLKGKQKLLDKDDDGDIDGDDFKALRKKEGVPHYTKDGKEWFGETHKMPDGKLMTENPHNEKSVRLYHADELISTKVSTGQDVEATKRTEENESELLAQMRARNAKTRGERK
jgi:hypothetical protein